MKEVYEVKKQTKIVGTLDKKGDEYIVVVNGTEYPLKDIIDSMLGTMVSFTNDEEL